MTALLIGRPQQICAALALALLAMFSAARAAETLTFIHTDLAGSPWAATDSGGNVVWREAYRPYGERTKNQPAAATNRNFFHGRAFDSDTGLTYFGARYYDAAVGRFMGVDPQGFDDGNLHSFNRYAYGNNNPYKCTDPDGRSGYAILGFGLLALGGYVAITGSLPRLPGFVAPPGNETLPGFGIDTGAGQGNVLTTPATPFAPLLLPGYVAGQVLEQLIFSQSGTSGENKFTAAGRKAHQQEPLPPGFERDVQIPGTNLRMDGYNRETKQIVEIKPNNTRQIRRGERQLDQYCAACDASSLGSGHTSLPVQTYNPGKYFD